MAQVGAAPHTRADVLSSGNPTAWKVLQVRLPRGVLTHEADTVPLITDFVAGKAEVHRSHSEIGLGMLLQERPTGRRHAQLLAAWLAERVRVIVSAAQPAEPPSNNAALSAHCGEQGMRAESACAAAPSPRESDANAAAAELADASGHVTALDGWSQSRSARNESAVPTDVLAVLQGAVPPQEAAEGGTSVSRSMCRADERLLRATDGSLS